MFNSFSLIDLTVVFRMMSDYSVETINDGLSEFNVVFNGPKESMLKQLVTCLVRYSSHYPCFPSSLPFFLYIYYLITRKCPHGHVCNLCDIFI